MLLIYFIVGVDQHQVMTGNRVIRKKEERNPEFILILEECDGTFILFNWNM
jgi:hypothetical protein